MKLFLSGFLLSSNTLKTPCMLALLTRLIPGGTAKGVGKDLVNSLTELGILIVDC